MIRQTNYVLIHREFFSKIENIRVTIVRFRNWWTMIRSNNLMYESSGSKRMAVKLKLKHKI